MSVFRSCVMPSEEVENWTRRGTAELRALGITPPENFVCKAPPRVHYMDLTGGASSPMDGRNDGARIGLPRELEAWDTLPYHSDMSRFTVVRWGSGPDDCGRISVDSRNNLYSLSVISYIGVTIEKWCLFASGVVIVDCDGSPADPSRPPGVGNLCMAPVHIERYAWLGVGVKVMPGVRIGHHATIGAGSVVVSDIPPNSLAIGNPAVVMRRFGDDGMPQAGETRTGISG